ncbi:ArsR/SmtB family transcription factor [Candidatus Nitrosocosmicus arcticus]|uniref:Putative transcriptional regulator ArsR family n=1 Tax=Candidatus Nitrosocosmicus arcticus TaxID=2035267 RepID=A0A557SY20_9ARCH|nr:ArsR family transcriptional regulator [Candidatus Nitrosocosmicus arcticus]TVP41491.1 putative transcriptional regulator ArsR family [Candidatus Nitrosocosmicus arcticus]
MLNYLILWIRHGKAINDDSRRQILILKDSDKTPSEISKQFSFSLLAVSVHLKILRESHLVKERKIGQNKAYSVNREGMAPMSQFFDQFWDDNLGSLS